MRAVDLIQKKRDGKELSAQEIGFLLGGYLDGSIPEYQISAWLMAVYFNGLTLDEITHLTGRMLDSGRTLSWPHTRFSMVDKHSTGGVGDKTTLIVAPIMASLDVPVAKLSGRGLGHTGGTLDKMETFTGIRLNLSPEEIAGQVDSIGICITGQTSDLVPADGELYALRDVTATVDQAGLIASSIISKKLALGADAIVLDVKCGDGGFNETLEKARKLAEILVALGESFGKRSVALITDMSQPLGYGIGNSLEVIEVINTLKGNGPLDLTELSYALASEALVLAGRAKDQEEARVEIQRVVQNGEALSALKEMVEIQGGSTEIIEDTSLAVRANFEADLICKESGFIKSLSARRIGEAAMVSGAGRKTKQDPINLAAGVRLRAKRGQRVAKGDVVATVFGDERAAVDEAIKRLEKAVVIAVAPPEPKELILARLTKDSLLH